MAKNIVIDKGIEKWAKERKKEISDDYQITFQVGGDDALPERASDEDIAVFCEKNDCDLFTADMTGFEGFFRAQVKTVRITNYDWWKKKYILLVRFEK